MAKKFADAAPVPKLQKVVQTVNVKKGAPVPGLTPMTTTPTTPAAQPQTKPSVPPASPAPKK